MGTWFDPKPVPYPAKIRTSATLKSALRTEQVKLGVNHASQDAHSVQAFQSEGTSSAIKTSRDQHSTHESEPRFDQWPQLTVSDSEDGMADGVLSGIVGLGTHEPLTRSWS